MVTFISHLHGYGNIYLHCWFKFSIVIMKINSGKIRWFWKLSLGRRAMASLLPQLMPTGGQESCHWNLISLLQQKAPDSTWSFTSVILKGSFQWLNGLLLAYQIRAISYNIFSMSTYVWCSKIWNSKKHLESKLFTFWSMPIYDGETKWYYHSRG